MFGDEMKKSLLFISSLIAPLTSFAHNIQVNFIGEIVESTCKISNKNNQSKEVILGSYATTAFPTVGSVSNDKSLDISFETCRADNYSLRITGNTVRDHSNLLAVTGGAIGVGVEIVNNKNESMPIFTEDLDIDKILPDRDNTAGYVTFNLRARYKSYQKNITPGTANSNAIFTISYK